MNTAKKNPFVSVILPVYNEERYLEECLKSLKEIDYPVDLYEIISVDNGSQDNSFFIAQQYADQCLLIKDVNVGAVRNYGALHSRGEMLVFLDSDCIVDKGWLRRGVELLKQETKSVYGGTLFLRTNPLWIEKYWLLPIDKDNSIQSDLRGSCIFIRKIDFLAEKGFDESITSGEDSDFSLKLKNDGFRVEITDDLGVVHLGNPVTVGGFIRRQIWHSENYIKKIKKSIFDKTFILVVLYLLSVIFSLLYIVYLGSLNLCVIILLLIIPAIFSFKRIRRANFRNRNFIDIFCIYIIDHLYLVGRSLGLLKGLCEKISESFVTKGK